VLCGAACNWAEHFSERKNRHEAEIDDYQTRASFDRLWIKLTDEDAERARWMLASVISLK
jgi:hypothetical protein